MIKAVFFDIDGTLIAHDLKVVPKDTRKALESLKKKGIKCVVASGRHLLEFAFLDIADLKFDAYVLLNGQLCLDDKYEVIFDNPISTKDRDKLIEAFNTHLLPLAIVEKDRLYINFNNEDVKKAQDSISSPLFEVGEYKGDAIYQITAFGNEDKLKELVKDLKSVKLTRWNPLGVDIIPSIGGKAKGIEAVLKTFAIKEDEFMAFGDGENDIDMLKMAKIGVAMGNSSKALKEVADFVSLDAGRGGISKALRHFEII